MLCILEKKTLGRPTDLFSDQVRLDDFRKSESRIAVLVTVSQVKNYDLPCGTSHKKPPRLGTQCDLSNGHAGGHPRMVTNTFPSVYFFWIFIDGKSIIILYREKHFYLCLFTSINKSKSGSVSPNRGTFGETEGTLEGINHGVFYGLTLVTIPGVVAIWVEATHPFERRPLVFILIFCYKQKEKTWSYKSLPQVSNQFRNTKNSSV